jgi:hypothetical protein
MSHILKIIMVGVLSLILFTSSASALDINTTEKTDTSIEITIEPSLNVSLSPEIYLNNNLIEIPIKDKLILDGLSPDTTYHITFYFNNPESEYYGEYYRIEERTEPSEHIQLESAIYTYGYILLIIGVLSIVALAKLPYGGFIPLFLTLAGVIHYIKYENQEPSTIIIYAVLMIISAYVVYIRSD